MTMNRFSRCRLELAPQVRRRAGLLSLATPFTFALLCSSLLAAAEYEIKKTTHVFKTVGDVKIEADVYRSDDDIVRPVLVWIHGGALIVGSREQAPGNLRELCKSDGVALVSLDYRLAPEAKLPQIAEDLDDAFRWLRDKGPALLHIDPNRMVVAGGSAGGFCAYLATSRMTPKPRAVVSYWGYGEFDESWTGVRSKDHGEPVAKEEALKGVVAGVMTGTVTKEQSQARGKYYRYLRQNGLWAKEVSGFDPGSDQDKLNPFLPIRNITSDFPPTLMVHGTIDTDVPYACSLRMAEAFQRHNVPYELVTVENAGHGLSGGDKERNQQAHDRALAFIREHLK